MATTGCLICIWSPRISPPPIGSRCSTKGAHRMNIGRAIRATANKAAVAFCIVVTAACNYNAAPDGGGATVTSTRSTAPSVSGDVLPPGEVSPPGEPTRHPKPVTTPAEPIPPLTVPAPMIPHPSPGIRRMGLTQGGKPMSGLPEVGQFPAPPARPPTIHHPPPPVGSPDETQGGDRKPQPPPSGSRRVPTPPKHPTPIHHPPTPVGPPDPPAHSHKQQLKPPQSGTRRNSPGNHGDSRRQPHSLGTR